MHHCYFLFQRWGSDTRLTPVEEVLYPWAASQHHFITVVAGVLYSNRTHRLDRDPHPHPLYPADLTAAALTAAAYKQKVGGRRGRRGNWGCYIKWKWNFSKILKRLNRKPSNPAVVQSRGRMSQLVFGIGSPEIDGMPVRRELLVRARASWPREELPSPVSV